MLFQKKKAKYNFISLGIVESYISDDFCCVNKQMANFLKNLNCFEDDKGEFDKIHCDYVDLRLLESFKTYAFCHSDGYRENYYLYGGENLAWKKCNLENHQIDEILNSIDKTSNFNYNFESASCYGTLVREEFKVIVVPHIYKEHKSGDCYNYGAGTERYAFECNDEILRNEMLQLSKQNIHEARKKITERISSYEEVINKHKIRLSHLEQFIS